MKKKWKRRIKELEESFDNLCSRLDRIEILLKMNDGSKEHPWNYTEILQVANNIEEMRKRGDFLPADEETQA